MNNLELAQHIALPIAQKGSSYGEARESSDSHSLQQSSGGSKCVHINTAQTLSFGATLYTQVKELSITSIDGCKARTTTRGS